MSNVENLSPQTIRQVIKEMHDIATNSPEGIKVQINDADVTDIQAILQGPGTKFFFVIGNIMDYNLVYSYFEQLELLMQAVHFVSNWLWAKIFPQLLQRLSF